MSDGKKLGTSRKDEIRNPCGVMVLAKFWRRKPLWRNGFNFVLLETKEKHQKASKNVFLSNPMNGLKKNFFEKSTPYETVTNAMKSTQNLSPRRF